VRIAVVGAGLGGLAAAGFLDRRGVDVTVYEQAAELRQVGAGITLTPNATRLVEQLDGSGVLARRAVALEVGWEFRRWSDGRVLFAERLGPECVRRYGYHTRMAYRADLLSVLRAAVPEHRVRLGVRCVGIEQDADGVGLRFADGSTAGADAVVGADGIHSVVCGSVSGPAPARFTGLCAYRCTVAAERVPGFARRPVQTIWLGPDRHFVHYPVSAGELVNVVAVVPAGEWRVESWSALGAVSDLAAEFAGWDAGVRQLIGAAESTGRWALFDREPLPAWSRGRVTLLGDAAHAMVPFFAQGAAQAIEDAAVLARCLADGSGSVEHALARYERARWARATRVQRMSRGRTDAFHLPDGPEQRARDTGFARSEPLAQNDWIYSYRADTVDLPEAVPAGGR
jgi:salicylate hydroxylase